MKTLRRQIDLMLVRRPLFCRCLKKWWGVVFGLAAIILTFVSCDEIGFNTLALKLGLLLFLVLLSFAIAIIDTGVHSYRKLWSKGNNTVDACYGDIFGMAENENSLCVIPVNTAFDTVIDSPFASNKPLVSPNSLHGKWLKWMSDHGSNGKQTDELIAKGLFREKTIDEVEQHLYPKMGRNGRVYPIGTVCPISWCGLNFLLLAVAQYDDDNMAHASRDDICNAIRSAIKFHDREGQGGTLLLPLIGTGKSRAGLSHQESFELTVAVITTCRKYVSGSITIVAYDGDKDKVCIW